jgi:hypothetical protein
LAEALDRYAKQRREEREEKKVVLDWTLTEEEEKAAKSLGILPYLPKVGERYARVTPRGWPPRELPHVMPDPVPKRPGFGEYYQDKFNAIEEQRLAEEFRKYGPKPSPQ